MSFEGFPEQALIFYEGLQADNSKAYWTDHRPVYDACVKAPMEALLAELEPEFGAAKFFRPYRDVRFAKDKTPYKDHAAALVPAMDGSTGLYVQLGADGLYLGGGAWHLQTDQVQRLRAAVDDDATGRPLAKVLAALERQGWQVGGQRLQRVPKPFAPGHGRADLLRAKTLSVSRSVAPEQWLHTAECADRIADAWRTVAPLNAWLHRHVGPSR